MFSSSALQTAIKNGLRNGDMPESLRQLQDYPVHTAADARAICRALRELSNRKLSEKVYVQAVLALSEIFQNVDGHDTPAFRVLYKNGLPELLRFYDRRREHADGSELRELVFFLRILLLYGAPEAVDRLLIASRCENASRSYYWTKIFELLAKGHPDGEEIFSALSSSISNESFADTLLNGANLAALQSNLIVHPFDSAAGHQFLQEALEKSTPFYSTAISAARAIPFVSNPTSNHLLSIGLEHPIGHVQAAAASSAARMGSQPALKWLVRFCQNPSYSKLARNYLVELNRQELIPIECSLESFAILEQFSAALQNHRELGRAPDSLAVVDKRELQWPPDCSTRKIWLIQYVVKDPNGIGDDEIEIGLHGGVSWRTVGYESKQRPPEDLYAFHCSSDALQSGLIKEIEVFDPDEYESMLGHCKEMPLIEVVVTYVAIMSDALNYPAKLVALATGQLEGEKGWVVLDGPRTTWFPESEQPKSPQVYSGFVHPNDTYDSMILRIHIGRQLLGFSPTEDRKRYLCSITSTKDRKQIITAYQRLMSEASTGSLERRNELLCGRSPLTKHFKRYIDALSTERQTPYGETFIAVYSDFATIVENSSEDVQIKAYSRLSLLADLFLDFIDELLKANQKDEAAKWIKSFEKKWNSLFGYSVLGLAWFRCGNLVAAEQELIKICDDIDDYCHRDEVGTLAAIWCQVGKSIRARELLADCLGRLHDMIVASQEEWDKKVYFLQYKQFRSVFRQLFPGEDVKWGRESEIKRFV